MPYDHGIPYAEVELDRKRKMVLDLNAMAKFDEVTGKSILEIGNTATIKEIRTLLWVALLRDDPEITEEKVGSLVHAGNLREINDKLNSLYKLSTPEAEEGKKDQGKQKAKNGKGPIG